MLTRTRSRGSTLIEAMVAMSVLIIGAMGMMGLHTQGIKIESDSRHITRATAIAQDLLSQLELWDYGDARLSDTFTDNLATLGDPAFAVEQAADPLAAKLVDHGEADLTAGGAEFHGLPTSAVSGYERFWTVGEDLVNDDTNGNGVADGRRVAVLVRWKSGGGWRRVVLLGFVRDPAEAR